jgi:hypothetical protein
MAEGARKLSGAFCQRALMPYMTTHDIITGKSPTLPKVIILEVRFQHMNFEGTQTFDL